VRTGVLFCLCACVLLAPDPYGRVVDSAAAVIRGASVRVINIEGGVANETTSDSEDNYEARNLIPGLYNIEVEITGFKRYQRGPQASFTWSKNKEAVAKLNNTDPYPTHAISTLDRPLHLVVSGLYELPVGKGKRFLAQTPKLVNEVVGGWSIQAIFQGQSGPPIGFGDVIFTGNLADLVLPTDQRTVQHWFNIDAGFDRSSQQQLANDIRTFPLRLTGLRANGYNNWDMSIFKGFQVREKVTFQLRAEAQDALNHAMFDAPNTNPTSTLFGQVTATVGAQQRVVTVGARMMW
jgi:hypothetical protein